MRYADLSQTHTHTKLKTLILLSQDALNRGYFLFFTNHSKGNSFLVYVLITLTHQKQH